MTDQIEIVADAQELKAEELDAVVGGLTCRKAGGAQQEFGITDGTSNTLIGLL
jgi:hypothetical protein